MEWDGWCAYGDAYPGDDEERRIVVPIEVGGLEHQAILDTGAGFNILHPDLAERHGLLDGPVDQEEAKLWIRDGFWTGKVVRFDMLFLADEGRNLQVEGSFFIPLENELPGGWEHPNFIGYAGALERIRFAVDPRQNLFFFARL